MKKCSIQAGDANISRYRDRAAELKVLSSIKSIYISQEPYILPWKKSPYFCLDISEPFSGDFSSQEQ